jgi:DedD protein
MGLFSSSKKNKHDKLAQNLGQDPGHFSRAEDEAIGEKARAKRASHAAGAAGRKDAPDPVLPEKKRARRRLVGAIALALAAIIGIPMLLDSEPKPLNGDIAIQIPSKEKAAPLPVPQAPAPVNAADTLDKREEIVAAPSKPEPPRKASKYDTELRDEPAPAPAPAKVEPKPAPKPEPKVAKVDKHEKPAKVDKPKPARSDDKHDVHPLAAKSNDQSRALAILEDKEDQPAKPAKVERELADSGSQRYVLQVVALGSQEKVTELQARLAGAGLRSYTEKSTAASGAPVIRVRVGPFGKDEAERTRAKLSAMGLPGTMVPTK